MARFNILALLTITLASGLAIATPLAEVETATPNQARYGFQYRFCESSHLPR